MTFLHPMLAAAGVCAIAIPIVIHLLMHRKRKPVAWGAMRFLVEAYKRQRRKLLVEKWLLLAARCLLVLLLALAIGRPLLGGLARQGGGRTVHVLIDNSLAASVRGDDGRTGLQRHREQAKAIIAALQASGSSGDRAGIITLGGPAEGVVSPATTNLSSLGAVIDGVMQTDAKADLAGALTLLQESLRGEGDGATSTGQAHVIVLSDFLEGSADLSTVGEGLGGVRLPAGVTLAASVPLEAAGGNVSIVGAEPLRSGLIDPSKAVGDASGELVRVRLSRSGAGLSEARSVGVRARLTLPSGEASSPAIGERTRVEFAPGQDTATMTLPVRADAGIVQAVQAPGSAGAGVLIVETDTDAIDGDNVFLRPVELRESLRVGIVAPIRFGKPERIDTLDAGSWARLALSPGVGAGVSSGAMGGIEIVEIEPASLDQARLAGLDAVVLPRPDLIPEANWARVRLFVESGGLAVIAPPPGVTVHVWGDAMARGLGLDWSVEREARLIAEGRVRRSGTAGAATNAEAVGGVLALIDGELADLLPAVSVRKVLAMTAVPEEGTRLLELDDRTPVLWAGMLGRAAEARLEDAAGARRGLIVYLGVALDLEYSDLPAKPLMVPLMQEIVRQGSGEARGSWGSIAGAPVPAPSRSVELVEVEAGRRLADDTEAGLRRLRVGAGGATSEPVRRAGVFRAIDESGSLRGLAAVNADPRGGRAGVQTREAVSALLRQALPQSTAPGADPIVWLSPRETNNGAAEASGGTTPLSRMFSRREERSPISLPLLIAALAVAVFEAWLARRASHAEVGGAAAPSAGGAA